MNAQSSDILEKLVTITFQNTANRDLAAHPVTYGLPLLPGKFVQGDQLAILQEVRCIPVQAQILEKHDDGSARWLLLDFSLPLKANWKGTVELVKVRPGSVEIRKSMTLVDATDRITVSTPHLSVSISKTRFSLFDSYKTSQRADVIASNGDATIEMPNGKRFSASRAKMLRVAVIESGPERIVIESAGRHTASDGSELFNFRFRYTFRPDEPGVRVSYKFTNAEAPERGVTVSSIGLSLPTLLDADAPDAVKHFRQCNSGLNWFPRKLSVKDDVEIIASKSTNEGAKARYGNAADGKVVVRNFDTLHEDVSKYPYFLRPGNARTDMTGGLRQVFPYLSIATDKAAVIGWFFEMGQNYPKGIRSVGSTMFLDIWPAWAGELLWRRGMSKEHEFYIACVSAPAATDFDRIESIYLDREMNFGGAWSAASPIAKIFLDPDYVRSTRVLELHQWLPYDENKYPLVELKMHTLGTTINPPLLGMMDFGDNVSADRSWAQNNENDSILNNIRQYYRMKNYGTLLTALTMARHNSTIDFIAHDPDPLRQGTMPAHCPEHTDGATYPSHMWCGGHLAAYRLTGCSDFRDVAISVGENMRRWQTMNPEIFYCDSRECGWPMLAWVQLWQHTRDPKWLSYAREVFDFYVANVNENGEILYDLPHGMGFSRQSYGEFVAWRACYFYYEATGDKAVRDFLVTVLDKVYKRTFDALGAGGWACNDLFPAWAAYQLTGDAKYLEDNYLFLEVLMKRQGPFPWGGSDVMFYFDELHKRGVLERFQR